MQFDHAAIACADVEAMRAWYAEVLRFEVRFTKPPSRPDARGAAYLMGPQGSAMTIELMPEKPAGPPAGGGALRETFARGLSHLALRVDRYEEWESRLTARGVRWTGEPVEALGGGKLRSFLDLEGNLLQIVERPGQSS
jgi:glyoxylase I family protein